jgi:hypothetical protein
VIAHGVAVVRVGRACISLTGGRVGRDPRSSGTDWPFE